MAVKLQNPSGAADEAAATHFFASQSARDAFVLHFISGRFSSLLVFFFDIHRTERHLSNLVGTVFLMQDPDMDLEEWREESLNHLANVTPDSSRLGRARKLFGKMLVRNGAQTLASYTLRRTLAPKGITGHLSMSGAHALWSYGEVVLAATNGSRREHSPVASSEAQPVVLEFQGANLKSSASGSTDLGRAS